MNTHFQVLSDIVELLGTVNLETTIVDSVCKTTFNHDGTLVEIKQVGYKAYCEIEHNGYQISMEFDLDLTSAKAFARNIIEYIGLAKHGRNELA